MSSGFIAGFGVGFVAPVAAPVDDSPSDDPLDFGLIVMKAATRPIGIPVHDPVSIDLGNLGDMR